MAGGLNQYVYAHNNPLNASDPSGTSDDWNGFVGVLLPPDLFYDMMENVARNVVYLLADAALDLLLGPPPPLGTIVKTPEKIGPPVRARDAATEWEKFLGSGPRTNIHPRTGAVDPDRIVVQTGPNSWRSIRFGGHEMRSRPGLFHYHEEVWTFDPATNTWTYENTHRRIVK